MHEARAWPQNQSHRFRDEVVSGTFPVPCKTNEMCSKEKKKGSRFGVWAMQDSNNTCDVWPSHDLCPSMVCVDMSIRIARSCHVHHSRFCASRSPHLVVTKVHLTHVVVRGHVVVGWVDLGLGVYIVGSVVGRRRRVPANAAHMGASASAAGS
jgi:hypothetical protein